MTDDIGAFIVCDQSQCSGCRACEVACFAAHDPHVGKTVGTVTAPVAPRLYAVNSENGCDTVLCRHCEDAPCMGACTQGAIRRINNQVILFSEQCVSCQSPDCVSECPFGAIQRVPHGSKCDLCTGHMDGPACVRACPHRALRLVQPETERKEKSRKAARALLYMC